VSNARRRQERLSVDAWKKVRLLLEGRAESVLNAREENFAAEINMFLAFTRSGDILEN
jgi:hypothetical protein